MQIPLKTTNHIFEKQNLVTIKDRKGGHDVMKCKSCGMKGKRYDLEHVTVGNNYSFKNANNCPKAPKIQNTSTHIKILQCGAFGKQFANLVPDSEHEIINPPKGENDIGGVWVMGVNEPVKVITGEFKYL